jgi:hypothetical protein
LSLVLAKVKGREGRDDKIRQGKGGKARKDKTKEGK